MYNMVLYLCVLIVFSLRRESLKLILATDPLPRWFCHTRTVDTSDQRLVHLPDYCCTELPKACNYEWGL
jgi:hypothetical protein